MRIPNSLFRIQILLSQVISDPNPLLRSFRVFAGPALFLIILEI